MSDNSSCLPGELSGFTRQGLHPLAHCEFHVCHRVLTVPFADQSLVYALTGVLSATVLVFTLLGLVCLVK